MFFKPEEFENAHFAFQYGPFENGAFRKRSSQDNYLISLAEFSSS